MNKFTKFLVGGLIAIGLLAGVKTTLADRTSITSSSTISAAGAVLSANNGTDFTSTSTTITNIGAAGVANSNTFTGVNIFSTSTIAQILNGKFTIPTNYATAGAFSSSTLTDLGAIINYAYFLESLLNATNTITITIPPLPSFTQYATPIVFGTNGEYADLECSPGQILQFTGTNGIIFDEGTGIKSNSQHDPHLGGSNCIFAGSTGGATTATSTAIQIGVTNGESQLILQNFGAINSGTGWNTATGTYMLALYNPMARGDVRDWNTAAVSNSGESFKLYGLNFTEQGNATAANCMVFNTNGAEVSIFGGSLDNCQMVINGGNFVNRYDLHQENTLFATIGSYVYTVVAASANTIVNDFGYNPINDATTTANSPSTFVSVGALAVYNAIGPVPQIGGVATSVSAFANGLGNINVCFPLNDNSAVLNLISGNGIVSQNSGQNSGCFTTNAGSWQTGWRTTSGNLLENKNGGNVDVINDANGRWSFAGATLPTSSLQTDGSFGAIPNLANLSSTLAVNSSPEQVYAGTVNVTTTLPAINASQGQIVSFINRGTANQNIAASTTAPDFIQIKGVTSTEYTITPGGWATFENDNTFWSVVGRSPQEYTTGSISGAIGINGCDTATLTVDTWVTSSTANFGSTFRTDPGATALSLYSLLTSPSTVTVRVCSAVAVTPTATTVRLSVN